MLPAYSSHSNVESPSVQFVLQATPFQRPQRAAELRRGERSVRFRPARFWLRPVWRGRVLLTLNQLAVMSQNGIELADAIEIVAENCQDQRLAKSLCDIHDAVTSGSSFSAAVATHGAYFPITLSPMLAAAEASGDVPATLKKICQRMRGELALRGTIMGALIYPAILTAVSTIVLLALVLGVLPQFNRVFESLGKPVPIYTEALLSFGDLCRQYWIGVSAVLLSMIATFAALRHHAVVQHPLGRLLMYLPFIREAYRPLQTGRVFRTVASMIQGGVPLLQAVQLAQYTTRDRYWKKLLHQIEDRLIDGLTASSALADVDFLPSETAQLMLTAEQSGRMGEVMEDVGAFYEEEAERRIKRLVVAMEPAIIVAMGFLVAGIVMSVMLPLLDVTSVG